MSATRGSAETAIVELRELRYFRRVADRGSFTQAATDLNVAQQSLSAAITRLERRLGLRLLERTTRKVGLTPAGAALLAGLPAVFDALDAALAAGYAATVGPAGTVRLLFGVDVAALVGPMLDRCRAADPSLAIEAREAVDVDALTALRAGQADLIIVWHRGESAGDLPSRTIAELDNGVVLSADDPLAGRAAVSDEDLLSHRLVLFSRELAPGVYDQLLRRLRPAGAAHAGVDVPYPFRPGQAAMVDAVARGGGFAPATRLRFDELGRDDVVMVGLTPRFTSQLDAVWRDDAAEVVHTLLALLPHP